MSDHRELDLARIRAAYAAYDREGRTGLWDRGNPGFARVSRERDEMTIRLLLDSLADRPSRKVLDVGCGDGGLAVVCRDAGVDHVAVTGVDLLADRLEIARERAPWATFVEASADDLPFAEGAYPVVAALTLFSSLPSRALESAVAREFGRVLEPGGWLIWYDLRIDNPRNPNVHGISSDDLRRIFPGWTIHVRPTTLLPPLARRLGRLTPALYPALEALPPLRSHLIGRLRCPT